MRLLDAQTKELIEVSDGRPKKYAILSHTWGKHEVPFHDPRLKGSDDSVSFDGINNKRHGLRAASQYLTSRRLRQKSASAQAGSPPVLLGSSKIDGCCAQALKDDCKYVWIDTCCIQKSSSAELSEAINSMFVWYKCAAICYVFLADVSTTDPNTKEFKESRWFTRGWTLQELLAPSLVVFYNQNWTKIAHLGKGTGKWLFDTDTLEASGTSFVKIIADITGISERQLVSETLGGACVAEKLHWASNRQTTREEDEAYCLLGIFNINMALLYGEGRRAFQRLQEELLRISSDHSLFAWGTRCSSGMEAESPGLLARSAAQFRDYIEADPLTHAASVASHYSMTNRGVHITLRYRAFGDDIWSGVLVPLDCRTGESKIFALALTQTTSGVWRRVNWLRPTRVSPEIFFDCPVQSFYIGGPSPRPIHRKCKLILETPLALPKNRIVLRDVFPPYVHASEPFEVSGRAGQADQWMFYLTELLPLKPSGRLVIVLQFALSNTDMLFYIRISCNIHRLPILDNERSLLLSNTQTGIFPGDPYDAEQSLADFIVAEQDILERASSWRSEIDIAELDPRLRQRACTLALRVARLENGDEEGRFQGWEKVSLDVDLADNALSSQGFLEPQQLIPELPLQNEIDCPW